MRIPLLFLSACLLSACDASMRSAEPPPSATLPCPDPVTLPDRALSDQDVEILWGRDRRALLDCGGQVEVLAGRPIHPGHSLH